ASDMTLGLLLHPERASRLIQQKSLDSQQIGLEYVLDQLAQHTIAKDLRDPYFNEVQKSINYRVLYHIMNLAAHKGVHPQVNAIANYQLKSIKSTLQASKNNFDAVEMIRRVDYFYNKPAEFKVIVAPKIPDGSPIGMDCMN
ncbi:MAG: peptidase, partial [Eudoraea sp.]|nr:peptidase [Eudoraea sp.]